MAPLRIIARRGLARVGVSKQLRELMTPTYFPAVSSICSVASPETLVRLLVDARYPRALVSAFDCVRRMSGGLRSAQELIAGLRNEGSTVILDSGLFEVQVLGDPAWSYADYQEASTLVPHDILLSFDGPGSPLGTKPANPAAVDVGGTRQETALVHIVHGANRESIVDSAGVGLQSESTIGIAVTDREAGPDLAARVRTIGAVRSVINEVDETRLLHVLGCGNPVVMAAYSMAGADTFDSLDWTQGAIDIRSLTLTDPLLLRQTGCKCKVCHDLPGPAGQLALFHNLLFYQRYASQLREMVISGTLLDFLQEYVGRELLTRLVEQLDQVGPR